MSVCASCGLNLSGDAGICSHHLVIYGDDWARANKIICDLLHRGIAPSRLSCSDLADEFWAHSID